MHNLYDSLRLQKEAEREAQNREARPSDHGEMIGKVTQATGAELTEATGVYNLIQASGMIYPHHMAIWIIRCAGVVDCKPVELANVILDIYESEGQKMTDEIWAKLTGLGNGVFQGVFQPQNKTENWHRDITFNDLARALKIVHRFAGMPEGQSFQEFRKVLGVLHMLQVHRPGEWVTQVLDVTNSMLGSNDPSMTWEMNASAGFIRLATAYAIAPRMEAGQSVLDKVVCTALKGVQALRPEAIRGMAYDMADMSRHAIEHWMSAVDQGIVEAGNDASVMKPEKEMASAMYVTIGAALENSTLEWKYTDPDANLAIQEANLKLLEALYILATAGLVDTAADIEAMGRNIKTMREYVESISKDSADG